MPSANYRYYCLDSSGHLYAAEWFVAESDQDAIQKIEARHAGEKCEVWLGTRLVAQLSPSVSRPSPNPLTA